MSTRKAQRRRSAAPTQWWEIPASWLEGEFIIRLREPANTSVITLLNRLRSEKYDKPYVLEDAQVRRLHFSPRYAQSEMSLSDPDALTLPYTQAMMAFQLLVPEPRDVVIVGLGGGSLTRYCLRHLPQARITTVEISDEVLACAELFALPDTSARNRLVHGDAVDYFETVQRHCDVVLLDGCDAQGIAPAFCEESFYRTLRAKLRRGGVVVVNLIGNVARADALLDLLDEVFEGRLRVLKVRQGGNRLVFAFQGPGFPPETKVVTQRAEALEREQGLPFEMFARQLLRKRR